MSTISIKLSICLYTDCEFSFQKDGLPIVSLPDGKVAGTFQRSAHNKTFYAFLQIPYASPPEGPLRFEVGKIPITECKNLQNV